MFVSSFPFFSRLPGLAAFAARRSQELLNATVDTVGGSAREGELRRTPIRVLLADDHAILRAGLASLLAEVADVEIVGQAEDGVQAVDLAHALNPDVIVMDVTMPRMNGIEATRKISSSLPGIRIIGLSMHAEADMADALHAAGAQVYLTKGGPASDLIKAVRGSDVDGQ